MTEPSRYVDSAKIPYLSVPRELLVHGASLGDVALVSYKNQSTPAIVGDVGPRGRLGEGSIALAAALGLPNSPRNGGVGAGVDVTLWLESATSPPWPRTLDSMLAQVQGLSTTGDRVA